MPFCSPAPADQAWNTGTAYQSFSPASTLRRMTFHPLSSVTLRRPAEPVTGLPLTKRRTPAGGGWVRGEGAGGFGGKWGGGGKGTGGGFLEMGGGGRGGVGEGGFFSGGVGGFG